jgi:hypothetical protein
MKKKQSESDPDMLPEYAFSSGVRGKYTSRYREGTNIVILEPEIAEVFTDSQSVNDALRPLADLIRRHRTSAKSSSEP